MTQQHVVTHVHRENGRIVQLFGSGWGPVSTATAIDRIENGECAYAVRGVDEPLNPITVVEWVYGKYLRTSPNPWKNLGELPEPEAHQGTRLVTEVHRHGGSIDELLGRDWGPVAKAEAIDDIEHGEWDYKIDGMPPNPIFVVDSMHGKYLRTPPNPLKRNLEDLVA